MTFARLSAARRRGANEPFRRHVARLAVARMISVTGSRAAGIGLVAVIYSRSGDSAALLAGSLITQRHTSDPVRARVFAASGSVNIGAMSVAMLVAGFLIGPLGPVALCVVCGVVTLSALVPSALVPPRGKPPWRPDPERAQTGDARRHRWLLAT